MKDLQMARVQEESGRVQLRQRPAPRKQRLQSKKEYPLNSDCKCVRKTSMPIIFEHDLMLLIDVAKPKKAECKLPCVQQKKRVCKTSNNNAYIHSSVRTKNWRCRTRTMQARLRAHASDLEATNRREAARVRHSDALSYSAALRLRVLKRNARAGPAALRILS
jgi:hypothetical protein